MTSWTTSCVIMGPIGWINSFSTYEIIVLISLFAIYLHLDSIYKKLIK